MGAPAFEEVATAACTTSTTDLTKLVAESTLFIELCQGLANGTFAGDLASKGATQTPAASKGTDIILISIGITDTGVQQLQSQVEHRGCLRFCWRSDLLRWWRQA